MIALVNGKGERVNDAQFQNWDEAEIFLWEQRERGVSGLYLYGEFGTPVRYDDAYYIAVEFGDQYGIVIYGLVIKAKHIPSPDELMTWIKSDMDKFGYSDIFEYYVTDEYDVYSGYDTENIDNWPVFGE